MQPLRRRGAEEDAEKKSNKGFLGVFLGASAPRRLHLIRDNQCVDCAAVTGANALSFGFPAERRYAIRSRISSSFNTSINPSGITEIFDGRRISMSDFLMVSVAIASGLG